MGFLGFDRGLSAIQVWHQGGEPCFCKPIGHPADLIVQSPPFLDHHDGAEGLVGFCKVALNGAAIGPVELDELCHASLLKLLATRRRVSDNEALPACPPG